MLVFNLPAGLVFVASAGAFAAANASAWRLVIGFGVMVVLGVALEFKPPWRPRYFWVLPAWLTGLLGLGAALVGVGQPVPGYVTIGAAGLVVAGLAALAIARKPGGKWMAGLTGSLAVVTGFQLLGYYRPEWKHPVLYVINALALVAAIGFGVLLYRARAITSSTRRAERRAASR